MKEDIKEMKALLKKMGEAIKRIEADQEMEDKVFDQWLRQYDEPVKAPYDYYYTMYPDVSTKPLTEQEQKTAFVPITEVETRTYYCGPFSKCRNEDLVRYNHD